MSKSAKQPKLSPFDRLFANQVDLDLLRAGSLPEHVAPYVLAGFSVSLGQYCVEHSLSPSVAKWLLQPNTREILETFTGVRHENPSTPRQDTHAATYRQLDQATFAQKKQ